MLGGGQWGREGGCGDGMGTVGMRGSWEAVCGAGMGAVGLGCEVGM